MRLARGWRNLLFFWAAIVSVSGAGAVTLQILGPPDPPAYAILDPTETVPASVQVAGLIPVLPSASTVSATPSLPEESDPGQHDATAPAAVSDSLPEPSAAPPTTADTAVAAPQEPIAAAPITESNQVAQVVEPQEEPVPVRPAQQDAAAPKEVQLRVVRDSKRCPDTPCYKWRLLSRSAVRQASAIDLAPLRLAPELQRAAEAGEAELIVRAREERKTSKGRKTVVVFVATDLVGVMPLDTP